MSTTSLRMGDWGQMREMTEGPPTQAISLGTIGHIDTTPEYVRLQDGRLLVEVTLVPSGEQVVATVNTEGGAGSGFYMPLGYGQKVVVAFPGGDGSQPVIVGSINDGDQPLPELSVPASGNGVPMFAFLRTSAGQMLLLETGDEGDVIIRSGASVQVAVDGAGQVLLTGLTHIGQSVKPTSPAVGAGVGPDGYEAPGVAAAGYVPVPNTNAVTPPIPPRVPSESTVPQPVPADGIVRVKDAMQSNAAIDPTLFTWITQVTAAVVAMAAPFNASPPGVPLVSLGTGAVVPPVAPPSTVTSLPTSGSLNTCADS